MRQRILVAGAVVLLAATVPSPLVACGDKFLTPPRGMTFEEAYRAAHPGSVLIYLPAGAAAGGDYSKIQAMLTRVGHRVAVVRSDEQVAQALAKADIVLTNLSDAGLISARTGASRTAPLILPVLYRATKAQTTACKLQYPCDLKSTDKPERFVVAVNMAMNNRAKALATKHGN